MKRLLSLTLALTVLGAALTGCVVVPRPFGPKVIMGDDHGGRHDNGRHRGHHKHGRDD